MAYNIGLAGESLEGFTPDADITSMTKAYMAGVNDKKAFRERNVQKTTFNEAKKGLSSDSLTETLIKRYSAKTREVLQNLGEALGVQIKLITNSGTKGHEMDSYYDAKAGIIAINVNEKHGEFTGDDLIRFVAAHEGIHRIKETSPKAYAEMEKLALSKSKVTVSEYMKKNGVSASLAKEEITADYFGDLLTNKSEIKALMNKNRGLFDIIREVIERIGNALRKAGIDFAEIAEARRLFREALSEADSSVWGEDVRSGGEVILSRSTYEKGRDDGVLFSRSEEAFFTDKEGNIKKAEELTETDFRDLLEKVQQGQFNNGTYIPMRASTPEFFIDVVREHSEGKINVMQVPMAAEVKHVRQNMEEEEYGISYGNARPHNFSVDDVVTISKEMGHPAYIVLQKNGRYAMVVSFHSKTNKKVAVSIAFANEKGSENYKYQQYMNGYNEGYYNIIVTQYEPDSLSNYLKNNEVVYDKMKMNGRYQVGSGRIVTFTHDTPFIDNSIPDNDKFVKNESSDKIRSRSEDGTKYFPKGEEPRRDIDVPSEIDGKKVMRGARTAAEAPGVSAEIAEDIVTEIEDGRFFYTPSVNSVLMANAESKVSENYDEAMTDWLKVTQRTERLKPFCFFINKIKVTS